MTDKTLLGQILYEVRGSFWEAGRPLSSIESVRLMSDATAALTEVRLQPFSVTVKVTLPGRPPVTIGDHSVKDAEGGRSRHLIAVDEARGVLVDPSLDMVRLKDMAVDPLLIEDLSAHKGVSGFLKGHRELNLEHDKARLKYRLHPRDLAWRDESWEQAAEVYAPLVERIREKLA